jgi:hypothetical protein
MDRSLDPSLCDIDFSELQLERAPFSDGGKRYYKFCDASDNGEWICNFVMLCLQYCLGRKEAGLAINMVLIVIIHSL